MYISDEEKRKIMNELARGNPELFNQEPSPHISQDDQEVDAEDYQNFDDFAQRAPQNQQRKLFTKSFQLDQNEVTRSNSLKEKIKNELNEAKEAGQVRAGRIREIVSSTVSQVAAEFKGGSNDIRLIVKDAVSTVIENFQEKGGEIQEEVTASIEGAIEGITSLRRQSIAKNQAEVKQIQARIDTEEDELQQEIERLLVDVEEAGKDSTPTIKDSIQSAINALKDSEKVALMQKRYAQVQAQAAILRANLAARYGGRYEEVKEHLDSAKAWYNQTRPQAEAVVDQVDQKRTQLEERLGEAGVALAKKERRIRQILSELLQSAAELLREKEPPSK